MFPEAYIFIGIIIAILIFVPLIFRFFIKRSPSFYKFSKSRIFDAVWFVAIISLYLPVRFADKYGIFFKYKMIVIISLIFILLKLVCMLAVKHDETILKKALLKIPNISSVPS
ncbi:hypothetical protein [Fusobacterium sp. PH5-44]|uniref:hypothetical protein n=1 Tax=unclassified Fusobacterium TaxID=2648384 RepID=UPI003D205D86